MRLYGHLRSFATWRVRIALALKDLDVTLVEQLAPGDEFAPAGQAPADPQNMIPVLETNDGLRLSQSLAIVEWLEEMWPSPALLPPEPTRRARIRAFALASAGDMHSLPTERSLAQLQNLGLPEPPLRAWARQALSGGLETCEALLDPTAGPFCFGDTPGLADLCLVPQLAMARQFGVSMSFPRLLAAEAACLTLPAFQVSRPLALP
ncbi:maleylacetoacetate isomerase [Roseomonas marmotae]|uniref:Maleylacetoacetate isomerase n=1 Tax=Roseomonas marmotae TaxID=2768161 RepID=A0ABS3KFY6_9PROT|nr:maleylacetoacetate isomerase [Roseomonas marmotae]MBO1076391.1 maleylacetoacetate isomerase [Roseomonas marmotae]QTI79401.1 maleylacetoacetate isomerase [Roseomonas marmotae]